MDEPTINPLVRQFINDHIQSVAQLELLLLLQTNPQQRWSSGEIARELRTDEAATAAQAEALVGGGVLQRDEGGRYRFEPVRPELTAACIALAQEYLVRRVRVISVIYAKPDNLRAFSDAFRLRKDPP